MVKEDPKSSHVKLAREKDVLYKCIKWDQACINKFRKIVTIVTVKVKLFNRQNAVRDARAKRCLLNKK